MVLWRNAAPRLSFAYIPWGPAFPVPDLITEFAAGLRAFLPRETAFLRIDPPWYSEGAAASAPALPPPWKKAAVDVQPPDTVIVSLQDEPETILARMKSKWRYNVRLGCRKVNVRLAASSAAWHAVKDGADVRRELQTFYELLKETAARDGIAVHSFEYYETLFATANAANAAANAATNAANGRGSMPSVEIRLYLAEFEAAAIAGIVTLFYGTEAVYLYGASSNSHRDLMATYALQWQAIQDAKAAGCLTYDLFGIPPNDNPAHPMAGLYRFKTGFGGSIIHRPGAWDYAYRRLLRAAFKMAELARKKLRDRKKR
jgi:lipid II:glycine glycyltransferase (peptidoglycan interpeptide bridge formation enzyme)